jgi:hypothetical protein
MWFLNDARENVRRTDCHIRDDSSWGF